MPLAPVELDDLTWQQMVDAGRRRIIAASGGLWTLHAPVDPGVAVLELFAWLLEQRLYFMDQVSAPMQRMLLQVLGQAPRPAVPAATVLRIAPDMPRDLPAGSELNVVRRAQSLVFTTGYAVRLVPITKLTVAVGGGEPVELGPNSAEVVTGGRVDLAVRLGFATPPPPSSVPLPLYVELEPAPDVDGEWVPGAPQGVPPPATLSWRYRGAAGTATLPAAAIVDGTGGLRRSGIVRLTLPADWAPEPDGSFLLGVTADAATFTYAPRLTRVEGNAVAVRHRRHIDRGVESFDWLRLAGAAQVALDEDLSPPLAETVKVSLLEPDDPNQPPAPGMPATWHDWSPVADLTPFGPTDRQFVVERDARRLRFGDGLTGRLPLLAPGANVKVSYDAGGGVVGNFGPGVRFESSGATPLTATNLVPSTGGADPEPPDAARLRAAADLPTVTRAVLAEDFVELAKTTPGLGLRRAYAAVGEHPCFPCVKVPGAVTLFIVPYAPRPTQDEEWDDPWVWAPLPDPGALAAVSARLDAARIVTTELYVRAPSYRHVKLTVRIEGDPGDPARLRTLVTRRLQRFCDPLVGGDDGEGWGFGEWLRPSALLRETQDALGDEADATSVRIVLDGVEPEIECADVAIRPHDLVELDGVEVQLVRVPARGGLR